MKQGNKEITNERTKEMRREEKKREEKKRRERKEIEKKNAEANEVSMFVDDKELNISYLLSRLFFAGETQRSRQICSLFRS